MVTCAATLATGMEPAATAWPKAGVFELTETTDVLPAKLGSHLQRQHSTTDQYCVYSKGHPQAS